MLYHFNLSKGFVFCLALILTVGGLVSACSSSTDSASSTSAQNDSLVTQTDVITDGVCSDANAQSYAFVGTLEDLDPKGVNIASYHNGVLSTDGFFALGVQKVIKGELRLGYASDGTPGTDIASIGQTSLDNLALYIERGSDATTLGHSSSNVTLALKMPEDCLASYAAHDEEGRARAISTAGDIRTLDRRTLLSGFGCFDEDKKVNHRTTIEYTSSGSKEHLNLDFRLASRNSNVDVDDALEKPFITAGFTEEGNFINSFIDFTQPFTRFYRGYAFFFDAAHSGASTGNAEQTQAEGFNTQSTASTGGSGAADNSQPNAGLNVNPGDTVSENQAGSLSARSADETFSASTNVTSRFVVDGKKFYWYAKSCGEFKKPEHILSIFTLEFTNRLEQLLSEVK